MLNPKNSRNAYGGKNKSEVEAYRKFVFSFEKPERTAEPPLNTKKTDTSSFDDDLDDKPSPKNKIKKSNLLKIRDFFKDNWFITIIGGILVALFFYLINISTSVNTINFSIENINKTVEKLSINNEKFTEDFIIFKTSFSKDIEYIKKYLGL